MSLADPRTLSPVVAYSKKSSLAEKMMARLLRQKALHKTIYQ
jgi:hypothetical protein